MSNSLKLPLIEQSALIEIVEIIRRLDNIQEYKDYNKYIATILDMDYSIVMYDVIEEVDFKKCKAMKSIINFVNHYFDVRYVTEEYQCLENILRKMSKFITIKGGI